MESGIREHILGYAQDPSDGLVTERAVPADSEGGRLIREHMLGRMRNSPLLALQPYFEFAGDGVDSGTVDGGFFLSGARVILELRLAPFAAHGADRRRRMYEWCFDRMPLRSGGRELDVVLRQLEEDAREFGPAIAAEPRQYARERHDQDTIYPRLP